MRTAIAQLPEFARSADKIFTTANAVVVLNGAGACRNVPVAASLYAEHLGSALRDQLRAAPGGDLRGLLREAIALTAYTLNLTPGDAPSSTVAIARAAGAHLDALALGHSAVVVSTGLLTDNRINALDLPEQRQYLAHLAAGDGYTEEHRRLVHQLQHQQAQRRNRHGGYWIAEADPAAAAHALTHQYPVEHNPWTILATDGAVIPITHRQTPPWSEIAHYDNTQLHALLEHLHEWEASHDPHGHHLPRAQQHDDKTIAIAHWNP